MALRVSLVGRPGLEAGRPREDLRPHEEPYAEGVIVGRLVPRDAGDERRPRPAPGRGRARRGRGRRAARRDPDDEISRSQGARGHRGRARRRVVLGVLHRACDGGLAAGDDRLDHLGLDAEGRGHSGGVEDAEASARARADVADPAAAAEGLGGGVRRGARALLARGLDRVERGGVGGVHQRERLGGAHGLEPLGARVRLLRRHVAAVPHAPPCPLLRVKRSPGSHIFPEPSESPPSMVMLAPVT